MRVEVLAADDARPVISDHPLHGKPGFDTGPPLLNGDHHRDAVLVEHLFLNPVTVALDEYGIPLPLARKLQVRFSGDRERDAALVQIRALDLDELSLSSFEPSLIEDARASM